MRNLRNALIVVLLVVFSNANAQDCGVFVPGSGFGGSLGGGWQGSRFITYPHVREADVMWMKRYWRVLDLREKINQNYFYPIEPIAGRQNLATCLLNSLCSSEAVAYAPIDDEFTIQLTRAEVIGSTSSTDTIYVEDEFGTMIPQVIVNSFEPSSVKRIRLKEDWIFHNGRSTLEKRIIGICPVMEKVDENGEYKGEMPLFWIYFPSVRGLLKRQIVQNFYNVAEPFNYDRLLQMRLFGSYIYKVSNVYDRKIATYKTGMDALLEGEKIEIELFNLEQDLWEY
jgi:gliding motility associated protien GldN